MNRTRKRACFLRVGLEQLAYPCLRWLFLTAQSARSGVDAFGGHFGARGVGEGVIATGVLVLLRPQKGDF